MRHRLDHPNVVTLFEIFEDSDTLSLAAPLAATSLI